MELVKKRKRYRKEYPGENQGITEEMRFVAMILRNIKGGVSKDLEWFSGQGVVIPEPSTPGVSYAKYLEELAERSAPLFLSHFYNI
ncbi:hypothetical protein Dsin_011064 [Dipteronia sinensis]|uniref:Uncharacterized protein n=1 Tax=Dipteronia sinensis TaxID=43782 RepID=A0AAE0AUZ3_9ROSI|nr:hypothetical protein Dsin_011064 [Dipteronia sinensis]